MPLVELKQIAQDGAQEEEVISWEPVWTPDGLFGCNFQYAESLGSSTTTSTTYVQKLRLTTPSNFPAGAFGIAWSGIFAQEDNSEQCKQRVQVDDTDTIWEINPSVNSGSTSGGYPTYGQGLYLFTTPGVHTIDFDYCTNNSADTAKIAEVRMKVWRVA